MFPNRGQLTSNSNRWATCPIGAYSIRYRQVQENFAKELEERKKEEKKRISERFRFNAEETLRRQKDTREKRKAFEEAEENHRREVLAQRKHQQRQVLTQAKVTTNKTSLKSQKANTIAPKDIHDTAYSGTVKRVHSFQSQSTQPKVLSKLNSYDSEPSLNQLKNDFPNPIGQGRIVLAVDANQDQYCEEDQKAVENRSYMNSALEQLIEELKQPNLDIERFTKQMSTTPFSSKSNKYSTYPETIKLFSDPKPNRTTIELNTNNKKDSTPTMTSRNTWISPSTESSTIPIQTPLSLTIIEDSSIAPLMHRPSNELIVYNNNNNNNKNVADSLDAADDELIRVISMESDSAGSNSPPLSPTLDNAEYPIDLQDSLEEPRIPTPPLPDLVPYLNAIPSIAYPSPEHTMGKADNTECNPWDLMGLSDSLDFRESQSLVLKESDIQDLLDEQEVEVATPKLVGILKTSKSPHFSCSVRSKSKRRVRFAGAEYMATGPQQHNTTHGMYSQGTFPYRVSTPSKGTNLQTLNIIGETKSLNTNSNPITIYKPHSHPQDTEFSLDVTPTDVDIHLIWNQIRENLRKSNNAVTARKFSNSDVTTLTQRPARMLTKRHTKINRVSIAPKQSDSDVIAWSDQSHVHREPHHSELSIEENKVLASLARLDTQLETKQAFLRTMKPSKQSKTTITLNYSGYKK